MSSIVVQTLDFKFMIAITVARLGKEERENDAENLG